jgi:hypothetical protein
VRRPLVEHPRHLLGVAAEVDDQRITLRVPRVEPGAVGGVDEQALDGRTLRGDALALRGGERLRMEDEAVLRQVHQQREADDDDQRDFSRR